METETSSEYIKHLLDEERSLHVDLTTLKRGLDDLIMSCLEGVSKEELQKVVLNIVKRKGLMKRDVKGVREMSVRFTSIIKSVKENEEDIEETLNSIDNLHNAITTKLQEDADASKRTRKHKKRHHEDFFDW